MLDELITFKNGLRLLIKFFIPQVNRGYINGHATEMEESPMQSVKSLIICKAGYLKKVKVDNKVEYKANIKHSLFNVMAEIYLLYY